MCAAKKKGGHPSSGHQKWEVILNVLKQMLRKQSQQLASLLQERQLLQERIQLQYQSWNSDVRLLEDMLAHKQRQLSLSELGKLVEIAKSDLMLGSNHRIAITNNLKLEHAQGELDDFKAWFDILSHRCPEKEDVSLGSLYESLKAKGGNNSTSKEAATHISKFENEIATLKREYEKLSMKHRSDISGLQDENTFVWNQYKEMEGKYTSELQSKNDEITQANEKILNLLTCMEQLQAASKVKDATVTTLTANIAELETEVNMKDGEISRLSKELELLKSKIPDSSTEPSSSGLNGERNRRTRRSVVLEEQATSAQLQVMVSTLRAKISELEAEAKQKSEEISILLKETKLLKSKSSADTPVLKRCINEPSSSRSRRRDNGRSGSSAADQVSFTQLEETVATLRVKISELEAERNQKNGEISALSKDLKLSKINSSADTHVLRRCTNRSSSSRSRGRDNSRDQEDVASKGEASSARLASEQGGKQSKRKQAGTISVEGIPRLFTSQFKIPKLRSQSPNGK